METYVGSLRLYWGDYHTALRPYLELLDNTEKAGFFECCLAAVTKAYPAPPDGTVLLPFPWLFIVAGR